jgi:hypothetical protein
MSYAYDIPRPDSYRNLRQAAANNGLGRTAVIDDKPYLIIDREKHEFVLEGEDGSKLWLEGGFDHSEPTEHNSIVAASRSQEPFLPGTQIGDHTIGNLAFFKGDWYVRNGDSDEVVPIQQLAAMLHEDKYFKDDFNSKFAIHFTPEEKEAMIKQAEVIETFLPVYGWHNRVAAGFAQQGGVGTITYPDGQTVDLGNPPANFFAGMMNAAQYDRDFSRVPVTVETDTPEIFWALYNDPKLGGGHPSMGTTAAFKEQPLPDTANDHFLDSMPVQAARSDYDHWNEDADYMW